MNKVLVCITIQENSKRLIEKGHTLAEQMQGELHVLNIRKGDTIFESPDSSALFEALFAYGSELGGQVHFLCSNDVVQTIKDFVSSEEITHLVVGQTPNLSAPTQSNIFPLLMQELNRLEIYILEREEI